MLIITHLSLMIAALLCFTAGIGMALFGRKSKSWLKWHKRFNTAGFCLLATGAATAFINVVTSEGRHLAGVHPWIGLITLILTFITWCLGFYGFSAANKSAILSSHRWAGRLSGLVMPAALALGLRMIGIL